MGGRMKECQGWACRRSEQRRRVLRYSRTCQGQQVRRCGGFLRSPPRCAHPQGPSCAGLPLPPLTRKHAKARIHPQLDNHNYQLKARCTYLSSPNFRY